jgi:hypothetical protein
MLWGKKSAKEVEKKEKLSGPREIPGPVQNYLVDERKMDPDLVKLLKAVIHKSEAREEPLNIRIFDNSEALAKKVQVKDYTSLDEYPDLMIYEGWVNERSKQVKLEEKKEVSWDTPIFTQDEIQQKIEALKEPGVVRSSSTWPGAPQAEVPSAWVLLLSSLIPTTRAKSRRSTSCTQLM